LFSPGAPPKTPLGSLKRSPDPLARLRGPTSKGRERERRGTGREKEGREGKSSGVF